MNLPSNYKLNRFGIFLQDSPVNHRLDEYDEAGFKVLLDMQHKHFWYKGRHRFLLKAIKRNIPEVVQSLRAIDLGGGVGGWITYLSKYCPKLFSTLALADSSMVALRLADPLLPSSIQRYQIDLMQLNMHELWDVAFLLDVIEHIPDDLKAIKEASNALKPGGYLFVTAPAFPQFWSYNDDMAQHLRRYRKSDFAKLADDSGLILCDARYFMFYLSPFYLLSRARYGFDGMTLAQKKELITKQHQVPLAPINTILSTIFAAESPIGHWLQFPWGTSILGVFRKT
jgi:SAM-dependent methyltransferase